MNWLEIISALRQQRYPPALRIVPHTWSLRLPEAESASTLDKDTAVDLANALFRLEQNASAVLQTTGAERLGRSLQRSIERLRESFERWNVRLLNPQGQAYSGPQRTDFERLGDPVPTPGLSGARIGACERPAVWLEGKLIQAARGVLEVPESRTTLNS
jgi:hypothetical protein